MIEGPIVLNFRNEVNAALVEAGFERVGATLRRWEAGLATLADIQSGFGRQSYINVGFWLTAIAKDAPDRVERCHIYGRLERLCPAFREHILIAGAPDEPSSVQALKELSGLLIGPIDTILRLLGTVDGLRNALKAGDLKHCLVTKAAREFLNTPRRGGA